MSDTGMDVVTGAFSYTGKYIAAELLGSGRNVRTITNHPDRGDPFGGRVEPFPYRFDDPTALARSLEGATTLYNTYWIRYPHDGLGFDDAVANSKLLFEAARAAGVGRIVHVSVSNPRLDDQLAYYRGKAQVERDLAQAGVAHSIVRPTLVYGVEDVLLNNIAWMLRWAPLFTVPGDGAYRVQPIAVTEVAETCVAAAGAASGTVTDAAGPEILSFDEIVRSLAAAVGSRCRIVHAPAGLALGLSRVVGLAKRDLILTREELDGLIDERLLCEGKPPAGTASFRAWLNENGDRLGRDYVHERRRHFCNSQPPLGVPADRR